MNLRHYVKQKKPETVEYVIYDSTYTKFKNKQNYSDWVRIVTTFEGKSTDWKDTQGTFWMAEMKPSLIWVVVTQL